MAYFDTKVIDIHCREFEKYKSFKKRKQIHNSACQK